MCVVDAEETHRHGRRMHVQLVMQCRAVLCYALLRCAVSRAPAAVAASSSPPTSLQVPHFLVPGFFTGLVAGQATQPPAGNADARVFTKQGRALNQGLALRTAPKTGPAYPLTSVACRFLRVATECCDA